MIVDGPGGGGVRARRHRPDRGLGGASRRPPAGAAGTTPATGTLAVLLASTSDLDDAIPTLVAYQLEWNKLHALLRAADLPEDPEPLDVAERVGGTEEDWTRDARVLAGRARRRSSTRSATAS